MTKTHFIFPVITWKNFSIYVRKNTHAPVRNLSEASPEPFFGSFSKQNVYRTFIGKVPGHAPETFYVCSRRWSAYYRAITIRWCAPTLTHSIESFHGNILAEVKLSLLIKVLLPTDAQENCFKRSIKIYIKTAPTCFGVITIIRERTIWTC